MTESVPTPDDNAKPAKPHPDFPLFAHATRRWAKKIKGKLHYFGPWSDPDSALALYKKQRADLEAGQTPRVSGRKVSGVKKPAKPHPDFPLFAHASGRWAKKVRGRLFYFGRWEDSQAALDEWLRVKDDLLAGRVPRPKGDAAGPDLHSIVNEFLTHKSNLVQTGELRQSSFDEYRRILKAFIDYFGRHRLAMDITPQDLEAFRAHLGKGISPAELGKRVQLVRSVYKYAVDTDLLDKAPKFGTFKRPSVKALRRARGQQPVRMYSADELRSILDAAGVPLKAMILLGLNCGFGQSDIAALPLQALDLDGALVRFPRPKTGVDRRCPLWPETVAALREAIEARPTPADPADAAAVFITKYGQRWVRYQPSKKKDGGIWIDSVNLQFGKALSDLRLSRRGGFYTLRRVHRTIADQAGDPRASAVIMGHADENDMAGRYIQSIDDERLMKVVNTVREWLYPTPTKGKDTAGSTTKKSATKRTTNRQSSKKDDQPVLRLVRAG